jgi:hypothetical protein
VCGSAGAAADAAAVLLPRAAAGSSAREGAGSSEPSELLRWLPSEWLKDATRKKGAGAATRKVDACRGRGGEAGMAAETSAVEAGTVAELGSGGCGASSSSLGPPAVAAGPASPPSRMLGGDEAGPSPGSSSPVGEGEGAGRVTRSDSRRGALALDT